MKHLSSNLACLVLLLASAGACASTVVDIEVTCPIDGKRFTTETARSGTQFGMNLDLKPYGAIIAPWPVAKCPGNGFIVYKEDFTRAELARLRIFVSSDEYQALQKSETNYYLAAVLMKHIGAPLPEVAFGLLKATWEVEGDSRYAKYAGEALTAFDLLAKSPPAGSTPEQIASYQLLAGEMERRLGRFDEARRRFEAALKLPGMAGTLMEQVAKQEVALAAAKDSATHPIAESETKK